MSNGFVIRIKGACYYVADGDEDVRCSVRGRFRIGKGSGEVFPVVGDNVIYKREAVPDTKGPTGVITTIEKRKSIFARGDSSGRKKYRVLAANLDFVFLLHAARRPDLNRRLLDRMLVAAECDGIEPIICINKIDLLGDISEMDEMMVSYEKMGYEIIYCSAVDGRGIEKLRAKMSATKSILAGPSGAGKTSLITVLEPGLDIRVGKVSEKTGKGRHTTSHFEFHRLSSGGYLGDTPGIREFGVWGLSKETLDSCFRDFDLYLFECRFATCTHSHEPGCSVKKAVEKGNISRERFDSYLRILEELPDRLK